MTEQPDLQQQRGWDWTKTYFFWGDGTYTTRRETVEADRISLLVPESKVFGLPRHPIGLMDASP